MNSVARSRCGISISLCLGVHAFPQRIKVKLGQNVVLAREQGGVRCLRNPLQGAVTINGSVTDLLNLPWENSKAVSKNHELYCRIGTDCGGLTRAYSLPRIKTKLPEKQAMGSSQPHSPMIACYGLSCHLGSSKLWRN